MVVLRNMTPVEFRDYIKGKEIVIFGAGRALDSCIDLYFENEKVLFVVDNNRDNWETIHSFRGKGYLITSPEKLELAYKINKEIVCFVDSPFYAVDVLKQLDSMGGLDGLECYIHLIMRNTFDESIPFDFTRGKQLIPKIIHYFWIGGEKIPDRFKHNVEGWKEKNPDYEIIQWDESNYDFSQDKYTLQAYENKMWGFASNLARSRVIYEHGGIYLDTDVKVLERLDPLLSDVAFFNMGCADMVNRGCGFGAVKRAKVLKEMIDAYSGVDFIDINGKPLKAQDHLFCHMVLKKRGFLINNRYQKRDGVVLYPSEVMSPLTINGMNNNFTQKTISIHQKAGSWKNEEEKKDNGYEISNILTRIQV